MKQHNPELDKIRRELELSHDAQECNLLLQRYTSPESRQAADALFASTDDELNNAYKG